MSVYTVFIQHENNEGLNYNENVIIKHALTTVIY